MAREQYLTSPPKTTTWPPGVPYIIGNEAAERFSYYGMNSILTIFMTKYLTDKMGHLSVMPAAAAEAWYHTFVTVAYFLPLLGAILADAFFGKFKVVFWLSIVYCLGHGTLALIGSSVAQTIAPRSLLAIGLVLIAMGAGGIKPCVSTNVGDQFGESNKHLLPKLFNWFYFTINAGSALSTLIIPWLLEPYKASAEFAARSPGLAAFLESPRLHSPDVAFGLPGIFMIVATIFFWLGRRKFVHIPPAGRQFFDDVVPPEKQKPFVSIFFVLAIGVGVWWWRSLGTWFFAADILLLITLAVWAVRPVVRYIFMPVPFVAMFWALWQQNFSSWVLQAESMNRHLFGIDWLSSQIQTVNPLFILIMLPLFSYVVYPLVEKVIPLTPLRKMGAGLFVTAASFFVVAVIQKWIDGGARPGISWQILAFVILTIGETLVSPVHLEFSYTQGPVKMKSFIMCTYLLAISLGNVFTAGVNFFIQNADGTVKLQGASYFMFFTWIMLGTAVLFAVIMPFYKGRTHLQNQVEEVEAVGTNIGLAAQPEL